MKKVANIFVMILISGIVIFLYDIGPLVKQKGKVKIFLLSTFIIIMSILFAAIIDYELIEVKTIGRAVNDLSQKYLSGFYEFMKVPSLSEQR